MAKSIRSLTILILAFLAPLFSLFLVAKHIRAFPPRAVWAWNFDQAVGLDIGFYKRLGIGTVYLQLPTPLDGEKLVKLRKFLKDASAARIEVYALSGDPSWALSERRHEVFSFIKKVLDLNSKMPAKFAGVHLDIEPYLLPEWKEDSEKILRDYLDTLKAARREAAKGGIRLEVDIPFWFDEGERPFLLNYGGKTAYASSYILDIVDGVTVMAYRRDIREIAAFCREELGYGQAVGKKIRVEIEVKDFADGGRAGFLKKVRNVEELLWKYPSFNGVAFHDLGSLVQFFGA